MPNCPSTHPEHFTTRCVKPAGHVEAGDKWHRASLSDYYALRWFEGQRPRYTGEW